MTQAENNADRAKTNAKGQGGETKDQTNKNANSDNSGTGGNNTVRKSYKLKKTFILDIPKMAAINMILQRNTPRTSRKQSVGKRCISGRGLSLHVRS